MNKDLLIIILVAFLVIILLYFGSIISNLNETRDSLVGDIQNYQQKMYELGDTTSEGR